MQHRWGRSPQGGEEKELDMSEDLKQACVAKGNKKEKGRK